LGETIRAGRAGSFSLRPEIAQNPSRLALARLDLTAAPGTSSLSPGDTRGADGLARAGQAMTSLDAAGAVGAVTQKLSDYAAGLSGHVARQAANAETSREAAMAVAVEATARRTSAE